MSGIERRAKHAAEVRATAAAVLAELPDDLRPDATSDRRDLAELLEEIGETWNAALESEAGTLAEQMRWSRVCVSAQRIADRLRTEIAADEKAQRESLRRPGILIFRRTR